MGTLEFNVGEKKYVNAIIRTKNDHDVVVINEAKWELYESLDQIFSQGDCVVSGDQVSALIETNKIGNYILKFIVVIGPEKIIEKTAIRVN